MAELVKTLDEIKAGRLPETAIPRMFYLGHTPLWVHDTPGMRIAHWQCITCKHEWDGEDGTVCEACGHSFPQYQSK